MTLSGWHWRMAQDDVKEMATKAVRMAFNKNLFRVSVYVE